MADFFLREHQQAERQVNRAVKESLLAHVAFEATARRQVSFSFAEAIGWLKTASRRIGAHLDSPEVIEELEQNGLLVRSEDELYSFSHELYQDYFAAVELVNLDKEGQLDLKAISLVGLRSELPRFYCDLSDNPAEALERVVAHNPHSGISAFIEQIESNPQVRARIEECSARNIVEARAVFQSISALDILKANGSLIAALKRADFSNEALASGLFECLSLLTGPAELTVAEFLLQALSDARLADVVNDFGVLLTENGYHQAAVRCYEASRRLGNPNAKLNFGLCLLQGQGIARDEHEVERLILECAEAGDPSAMREAGALLGGWRTDRPPDIEAELRAEQVRSAQRSGGPTSQRWTTSFRSRLTAGRRASICAVAVSEYSPSMERTH